MRYTIWLIPEVFDLVWRDERDYVVCEAIKGLRVGDTLAIEEGDEDGSRSGRVIHAGVEAVTPGGAEGLPRDLCVFQLHITGKRAKR